MMDDQLHTVWCDDIRLELQNKLTVVGVYSGQAVFPAHPAAFLKLCAWVTYTCAIEKARGIVRIVARRDDGTELGSTTIPANDGEVPSGVLQEGMTRRMVQVALTMQQLVLPEDCRYLEVIGEVEETGEVIPSQKLWILANEEAPKEADA